MPVYQEGKTRLWKMLIICMNFVLMHLVRLLDFPPSYRPDGRVLLAETGRSSLRLHPAYLHVYVCILPTYSTYLL